MPCGALVGVAASPRNRTGRTKVRAKEMVPGGSKSYLLPPTCWEDRQSNCLVASPMDWKIATRIYQLLKPEPCHLYKGQERAKSQNPRLPEGKK